METDTKKSRIARYSQLGIYPANTTNDESQPQGEDTNEGPELEPVRVNENSVSTLEIINHTISFCGTVAIVIINFTGIYIMDLAKLRKRDSYDDWIQLVDKMLSPAATFKYFQFISKAHELFMLSSLSFVLVHYFQSRLLKGGIPFEFLHAPYMVGAGGGMGWVTFFTIWKFDRGESARLGFILAFFSALTFGLGPSSAIAMIPSLSWWPVKDAYGGENFRVFVGLPQDTPWPTKELHHGWSISKKCFDLRALAEPSCPGAGWSDIQEAVFVLAATGDPTNITLVEPITNTPRLLLSTSLEDRKALDYQNFTRPNRRISTANTAMNAATLGGFWNYVRRHEVGKVSKVHMPAFQSTSKSSTYQPLVYSQCHSSIFNQSGPSNTSLSKIYAPWRSDDEIDKYHLPDASSIVENPPRRVSFAWFPGTPGISASSLTILPIELLEDQSFLVVLCAFDARWAKNTIRLEPFSAPLVQSSINALDIFEDKYRDNGIDWLGISRDEFRVKYGISDLITLPDEFLSAVSFGTTYANKNMSSIEALLEDYTVPSTANNSHFSIDFDEDKTTNFDVYCRQAQEMVGTAVGASIADGLARYHYRSFGPYLELQNKILGHDSEYIKFVWSNWTSGSDNASRVFGNTSKEDAFFMEFSVQRNGYGYGLLFGSPSVPVAIAVSVLCLYLLVIVVYVPIVAGERLSGSYIRPDTWDTIQSLVALAMNSKASQYLEDMITGVTTERAWELDAKVRMMPDGRLNLVVSKGEDDIGERLDKQEKKEL